MDDIALRGPHDYRFGRLECRQSQLRVAAGDRFLDFAYLIAQQCAAHFVDFGLARDLARSFTGGTGIGHAASRWRLVPRGGKVRRSDRSLQEMAAAIKRAAKARLIVRPSRGVNAREDGVYATFLARTAS